MSSKPPTKVQELAQLMTVPEMLAALGGSVSRKTSTNGDKPQKDPDRCFTLPNGELRCTVADFLDWLDSLEGRVA